MYRGELFHQGRFSYPHGGWCADCQKNVPERTEWFGGDENWRGPLVPLAAPQPVEDEDW